MMEVALPLVPFGNHAGNSMEIEFEDALHNFWWTKSFVSSVTEGFFAVLTDDLRKEVWSHIMDDTTFANASRVNKKWHKEMQTAWLASVSSRNLLTELNFWEERGKSWKWVLQCKTHALTEIEMKNSAGIFIESNGTYEGEWKENQKDGLGKKSFSDKSVYMGQWKGNMKQGQGVYLWEDGTKYEGFWREDRYDGFGVKSWGDGDKYTGTWKEDKKHGKGQYTWVNGDRYDGEWKEDKQHGDGNFLWATGVQYIGKFKDNARCDTSAS